MRGSMHSETPEGQTWMQHKFVGRDAGAWALLLTILGLCLCAAIAGAQSVPNVVMSQVTTLALLPTGGALAGSNPSSVRRSPGLAGVVRPASSSVLVPRIAARRFKA